MKRGIAASLVLLMLSACVTTPTTATSAPPATSSTPDAVPTTGEAGGRPVATVDCEDPPTEVAIVCESYQLILDNYVDTLTDEALAAAANEGLLELTMTDTAAPLVCAVPAEPFDNTCERAAEVGLDTPNTAEAIVTGMVSRALDPNSTYFDPVSLALLDVEDEGEIEGIGALVSPEDETIEGDNKQCSLVSETCQILIISTIEGAPAQKAGLQRDDVMVAVDGEPILGWTVDEVTSSVRGPAGTPVTITIDRGGRILDLTMVRAAVRIPVLETEKVGDIGYVRLFVFSDVADEEFAEAVVDLLAQGVDRLVIDLRDNPGGLLDTAIDVTSVFLEDGDVIITQGPEEETVYPVSGAVLVPSEIEVDFVVNKGSASASEVVSAVLQERGRVTVLGEATFGKNTVQQRFSLSNGGALRLTIARWVTPGGLDFGGTGVTPDVELPLTSDLEAAEVVAAVVAAT
jgi:carboxyl-terminal processing protease